MSMDKIALASNLNVLNDFQANTSSGRNDQHFSQMLTDIMNNTRAEISPILDSTANEVGNLQTTLDPYLDQSDTSKPVSTLENTNIPTSDIRLIDDEVHKIADNLRSSDAEAAQRIDALAGSPGGVSLSDVVSAAANDHAAQLTDADMTQIESLINEVDSSGTVTQSVLNDLRNGNTSQAWSNFKKALNSVEGNLSVDKDQLVSFGKALKLSKDTLKALQDSFGKTESLSVNVSGLKKILSVAEQELTRKNRLLANLGENLEKSMKGVISDARKRMQQEAATSNRTSRRTQQSQILIEDTVKRNGFDRQNDAIHDDKKKTEKSAKDKTESLNQHLQNTQETKSFVEKGKNSDQQNGQLFDSKNAFSKDAKADIKADAKADSKKSHTWDTLLNKVNVNQNSSTFNTTQSAANPNANAKPASPYSAQVLNQVEKGMLSAMADGTKHLELQLKPVELGTINVLLTSKNGEISAILKAERPETTSLLQNQLASLRAELEQQGIKVDQVEVQTQLQDQQNMNWQGLAQHNAMQDQQERTLHLNRLRRLSRIGMKSESLTIEKPSAPLLSENGRLNLVA